MEYNDDYTLDLNTFEKMAKEYNSKVYKFNNVSVYKFDINSVFKSQLGLSPTQYINAQEETHNEMLNF